MKDVNTEDATHGDGIADENNHVGMVAIVNGEVIAGWARRGATTLCVNVSDLWVRAPEEEVQNGG